MAGGGIADDLRLKLTHFRILAHVGRQNHARGWLRVSQSELSQRWACHRVTLNTAFRELVAWGYLEQRTQEEAGESFCLYKVVLDNPGTRAPQGDIGEVGDGGECSPEATLQGEGECSPETTHVKPQDYTCVVPEATPPTLYIRAHRLSPTIAEKEEPLKSPRREAARGDETAPVGTGEARPLSARDVRLLADLEAWGRYPEVIRNLICPILAAKRFSAEDPLETLKPIVTRAARLPSAHRAKVLELVLDAPVSTVKAARLVEAIAAVETGGLMLVIDRRQHPQRWAAWARYYASAGTRSATVTAALMRTRDVWQVPSEWPPNSRGPSAAHQQPGGSRGPSAAHCATESEHPARGDTRAEREAPQDSRARMPERSEGGHPKGANREITP